MQAKHCCVIDADGFYTNFVLVQVDQLGAETILSYELKDGESLVDASPPSNMIAPRWTGTEWEETGTREITAEDMEQLRAAKLSEIGTACSAAIAAGVDVETSEGTKHFSLSAEDQANLTGLMIASASMEYVPYHADGEICKPWPAAEFRSIASAAVQHVTTQTTYCNHLNVWIRREADYDTLSGIAYGCGLPTDLAANMAAVLGSGGEQA